MYRLARFIVLLLSSLILTALIVFSQSDLAVPANLRANGRTVSWDAVLNASGYRLRWLSENGTLQYVETAASTTQYTFTQLTDGVGYPVYVQAKGDGSQYESEGPWSSALVFTPHEAVSYSNTRSNTRESSSSIGQTNPSVEATLEATATATSTESPCTLRDAIIAANTDAESGGCAAGSGADTITLTEDVSLTEMLPTVSTEITINGNGHSISGSGDHRLMQVHWSGNLTLSDLTLTNGNAQDGGAVYNEGILAISNSTLNNNRASGVGGAITSAIGYLTIERSSFLENSARNGGAIYSGSDISVDISNVTISGNTGSVSSAGLHVFGSQVTITHSTFYQNSGQGLNIQTGTVNLRNSVIAGSSQDDCTGILAQNVNNYIEDGSCSPAFSSSGGGINLGALIGSPAYHPPQAGSAAINAGHSDHCEAIDQAGQARPIPANGGCDIGSIELQIVPPTATSTATATDTPTSTPTATETDTGPAELSAPVKLAPCLWQHRRLGRCRRC